MRVNLARTAPALAALVAVSAFVRTRELGDSFWIDEGLTAGISAQPLLEIPGLLRLDGSPPLYYLLLHGWLALVGDGDAAARTLSVLFGLAVVPVAFWAGRGVFGARAGWVAAALAAVHPFLTFYAQELRMYALVALLSVIAAAAYVRAFVRGERVYVIVFAVALTLLLYTHNWALFLALGAAAALPVTRARPRDAALAFGASALAFAPWLPTLLFQARHTGAPWANEPPALGAAAAVALVAAGVFLWHRDEPALASLGLTAGVALGAAWTAALVEPMWATRYAAVLVGPLLLGAAAVLARGGRAAAGAVAVAAALWLAAGRPADKSNVEAVAGAVAPQLRAGDLVISTQPEQVPTLHRYLGDGLRYASPLGVAERPSVMDWRDALARLREADPTPASLLATVPAGGAVLLVEPHVGNGRRWRAAWTRLVHERSRTWRAALERAGTFARVERVPNAVPETSRTSVRATLYRRLHD